jgi:hypothetical protein
MILPILVAPRVEHRWFYVQTNLLPVANVEKTLALMERAAKAGYNGMVLADSKIETLDHVPDGYTANVKRVRDLATKLHIELIPSVLSVGWADGMLSHNPNLVEAQPVRDVEFRFKGNEATAIPTVALKNADFSEADGHRLKGWNYQDGPGTSSFVESSDKGMAVRMQDFKKDNEAGNCRLIQSIDVRPWHQYRMWAWVKSQDLDGAGDVRMTAIAPDGKSLTFQSLGLDRTSDWRRVSVVFNSQANTKVNVYWGIWSGSGGKLWWSGLSVEDAGLLNVVRRPLAPLRVVGSSGVLSEGKDFEKLVDPSLGQHPWAGQYTFDHVPPVLRRSSGGGIHDGDVVKVDAYTAVSTDVGKTSICVTEAETKQIEEREIGEVAGLFSPEGWLLSADEVRVANWSLGSDKTDPGKIYAGEIAREAQLVRRVTPRARVCVWSDMFDPFHNAHADYYLSNGSWEGSWKGLPKDCLVINWNFGERKKSLPFFEKLGVKQILAGYYDSNVQDIRTWLDDASGVVGVTGVMYTTWSDDYSKLEEFAKAAWGG